MVLLADLSQFESFFDFTIMRILAFDDQEGSAFARIKMLQVSFERIAAEPLFGYGINSSPVIIDEVYPHNMFLEAWLDAGIVGVGALAAVMFVSLAVSGRLLKESDKRYIAIINLYIVLAHLKSFSILHGVIVFFVTGIVFSYHPNLIKR